MKGVTAPTPLIRGVNATPLIQGVWVIRVLMLQTQMEKSKGLKITKKQRIISSFSLSKLLNLPAQKVCYRLMVNQLLVKGGQVFFFLGGGGNFSIFCYFPDFGYFSQVVLFFFLGLPKRPTGNIPELVRDTIKSFPK